MIIINIIIKMITAIVIIITIIIKQTLFCIGLLFSVENSCLIFKCCWNHWDKYFKEQRLKFPIKLSTLLSAKFCRIYEILNLHANIKKFRSKKYSKEIYSN